MDKERIKTAVQELARQNFRLYSEDYEIIDLQASAEAIENVKELAINYFENDTEQEAKENAELGIDKSDYVDWVMDEFDKYVQDLNDKFANLLYENLEKGIGTIATTWYRNQLPGKALMSYEGVEYILYFAGVEMRVTKVGGAEQF